MKELKSLILRVILCFLPINIFYIIFTPLTVYGSYLLLFLYKPILIGDSIFIQNSSFDIVSACVAGFAYFLLWVLVLLTKKLSIIDRIKIILTGFLLIYLFNIIRISFFIFLGINYGFVLFDQIHMIFWNLFSGIFVALVWIALVYMFKIKSIPIYDYLKEFYKKSLLSSRLKGK